MEINIDITLRSPIKNIEVQKNPCSTCPNNPMNNPFASGVCNCALPYLYNPIFA